MNTLYTDAGVLVHLGQRKGVVTVVMVWLSRSLAERCKRSREWENVQLVFVLSLL